MVPGCGAVTRRRWNARSKSGSSSQRGGAGGGEGVTRCRNMGMVRLSSSNRSTSCSQFGVRSSKTRETMVDRSRGSLSIDQVKASVLRRKSAMATPGDVDGQVFSDGVCSGPIADAHRGQGRQPWAIGAQLCQPRRYRADDPIRRIPGPSVPSCRRSVS